MGLFDEVLGIVEGNLGKGLAIGIGASILAPVVIPAVSNVAKPLLKTVIKGGIIVYEKGLEAFSEVGEVVEDLIAEARAELHSPSEGMGSGDPSMKQEG